VITAKVTMPARKNENISLHIAAVRTAGMI
jgi:hypothetical protein